MGTELEELGLERLVIAVSHPSRSAIAEGGSWADLIGPPGQALVDELRAVGVPEREALWTSAARSPSALPGGFALVGVPGMPRGAAHYSYSERRRASLIGYLSADRAHNFGYVPAARVAFDTRAENGCGGACATHTVGQPRSGSLQDGESGYLVTAYDPGDLRAVWSRTYATNSPDRDRALLAVERMDQDLAGSGPGQLIAVTSIVAPDGRPTAGRVVPVDYWRGLADAIADVGGTRDAFNRAARAAGSGYSLFGRLRSGEGHGSEAVGAGARLRGALVPNRASQFRPLNVSADGPPADRLQQLLVRPPAESVVVPRRLGHPSRDAEGATGMPGPWPLDDDPGARKALAWIGGRDDRLGVHPRSSYWFKGATLNTDRLAAMINELDFPSGQGFSENDFEAARDQLVLELGYVGNVRDYMRDLSAPYTLAIQDAFPEGTTLADDLETELKLAKEKAEMKADWFALVKGVLSFAGGFEGFVLAKAEEAVAHIVELALETSIAAMEMGAFGYESKFDGSDEELDEDPRVIADRLELTLMNEADENIATLDRMANIIVSDYAKLQEIGEHGGCKRTDCPAGMEEYATDSATVDQAKRVAKLSLERTLYSDLVPRSFAVWDTGLTGDPEPSRSFDCTGLESDNSPFYNAPELAWTTSLDELDPAGVASRRRVSIMVHRDQGTYSWPSRTVLRRMFEPVDLLDAQAGGLGLSAQEVMRHAEIRYEPSPFLNCHWFR
jgi:hypothetical protein